MKVLIIGAGGREHALVKALSQSPLVTQVFAMPGSDGIAKTAILLPDLTKAPQELINEVKKKSIELVIIGPEIPLVDGLATLLRGAGCLVFGPNSEAAQLEGSKIFSKEFMIKNEIATARAVVVKSVEDVRNQLKNFKKPYVLKADGLAAGKGVFISSSEEETIESAKKIFEQKILGSAGDSALLEEPLIGHEISAFVLVGDSGYRILPFFKDHKRLQENDLGPNTGGMGVIGPVTIDAELEKKIIQKVVEPSVRGIRKNNWTYRGLLYIGLMIVDGEPLVLEYNVRFGDPEAQCILPLLDGDWAQVLAELSKGEVPEIDWKSLYACCVVLAAPGYPDNPLRGEKILGDLHRSNSEGYLLHAGTKKQDSNWVSNGGRVLNAIGLGQNQTEAIKNAYKIVDDVHWPKKVYRRDIGNKL